MFIDIRAWCMVFACASAVSARDWAWPESRSESVRIDTKVRFVDDDRDGSHDKSKRGDVQADDEAPFRPPTATDGFYNRPPGAGQFPVRVVPGQREAYRVDGGAIYPIQNHNNNEHVDNSIQYCKCVSTPDCNPRQDSAEVCGPAKYLCCFKRPNKVSQLNSEIFNEIEDERPMLFPGQEKTGGPFPPPPGTQSNLRGHDMFSLDASDSRHNFKPILVGPGGPTDVVRPPQPAVLVGPNGPTGVIGPAPVNHQLDNSASAQNILVGPGGPTGIIGPYQRRYLTGPRGSSGAIGPNRGGSRGVLVGPGGPTGIIGPAFNRQNSGPGLLVGPGGPTGTIGPGRQLLVGPGGPTGRIGPQRYFESETSKLCTSTTRPKTEPMVKNKTGTEFSRNPGMYARASDSAGSAPSADDDDGSLSHATASNDNQSHTTAGTANQSGTTSYKRVRRGGCLSGCGNVAPPAPPMSIKKKGYRVKLPDSGPQKPVHRSNGRKRPKVKNTGCSRSDGGCGSVAAPLPLPPTHSPRRAGMGIGEYHPKPSRKQPKRTTPAPPKKVKNILRAGGKDKGQEVLSQLFAYMVTAYLDDMRSEEDGRVTTTEHARDIYGEIIYTTLRPSTVKPSPLRKIPIYLAALKVVKAMIVFGIM